MLGEENRLQSWQHSLAAYLVEELAGKPGDLRSILGTHMVEEKDDSHKS